MNNQGLGPRAAIGGSSTMVDEQGQQLLFPSEFLKKKRLYIVQNTEEVNQQEYENEMENQAANEERYSKNAGGFKGPGDKDRSENHSKSGSRGDKSKKDKGDAAGNSANSN